MCNYCILFLWSKCLFKILFLRSAIINMIVICFPWEPTECKKSWRFPVILLFRVTFTTQDSSWLFLGFSLLTSFIYFAGQVCLLHSPNNVHSESLIRTNLEQFRVMVKSSCRNSAVLCKSYDVIFAEPKPLYRNDFDWIKQWLASHFSLWYQQFINQSGHDAFARQFNKNSFLLLHKLRQAPHYFIKKSCS